MACDCVLLLCATLARVRTTSVVCVVCYSVHHKFNTRAGSVMRATLDYASHSIR